MKWCLWIYSGRERNFLWCLIDFGDNLVYKFIDDNKIEFYIQTKDLVNKTILEEEKTILHPYRKELLIELLKNAGFNQIKLYNEVDFSVLTEDAYVITFHAFK